MNSLTVLADDLTGALDSAGRLAGTGKWVPVLIRPGDVQHLPPVAVLDLNTRHAGEEAVCSRIGQAVLAAREGGIDTLYLKLDSTLRGPVVESIRAAWEFWNSDSALFCPAFPGQGRTVKAGRLLVKGVPVNLTVVGRDGRSPVLESSLSNLLARVGRPVHHASLGEVRQGKQSLWKILQGKKGLWTADAETESDLKIIASAAAEAGITLLAGSAGLVRHVRPPKVLTGTLSGKGIPREMEAGRPPEVLTGTLSGKGVPREMEAGRPATLFKEGNPQPGINAGEGSAVFVSGSRHPNARRQVQALRRERQDKAVLISVLEMPDQPGKEDEIARQLACRAAEAASGRDISALVVTGGDTARAVVERLEISRLLVGGEVLPGIPFAVIADGPLQGKTWISKAGGFGSPGVLVRIARWLELQHRQG